MSKNNKRKNYISKKAQKRYELNERYERDLFHLAVQKQYQLDQEYDACDRIYGKFGYTDDCFVPRDIEAEYKPYEEELKKKIKETSYNPKSYSGIYKNKSSKSGAKKNREVKNMSKKRSEKEKFAWRANQSKKGSSYVVPSGPFKGEVVENSDFKRGFLAGINNEKSNNYAKWLKRNNPAKYEKYKAEKARKNKIWRAKKQSWLDKMLGRG